MCFPLFRLVKYLLSTTLYSISRCYKEWYFEGFHFPLSNSHHRQAQHQQKDTKHALPSVGDENIIDMTQPVASWQRTVGKFLLVQLPGERGPIEGILLLSLGSQRTARSCAMWRVFTWYVTLTVTPYYRAPREAQWSHYQLGQRNWHLHTPQKQPTAESFEGNHHMPANFISTWHILESLEMRESQLRKRLHKIRLQASL